MSDSSLYLLASSLLAGIETQWAGEDLPDRRYVADGETAWDFESFGDWPEFSGQLTVRVVRVYPHTGDARQEFSGVFGIETMLGAEVEVQVLRCVPGVGQDEGGISIPSAEEIEASAAVVLADAMDLWAAVLAAKRAGDLPGCNGVTWMGWSGVGPQGYMGGGSSTFRLDLAG